MSLDVLRFELLERKTRVNSFLFLLALFVLVVNISRALDGHLVDFLEGLFVLGPTLWGPAIALHM